MSEHDIYTIEEHPHNAGLTALFLAFFVLLGFAVIGGCDAFTPADSATCESKPCGCFATACPGARNNCCSKDEVCSSAGGHAGCGWVGPPFPDPNGAFGKHRDAGPEGGTR